MKIRNLVSKKFFFYFAFLMFFVLTTDASAWSGDGTPGNPYMVDSCGALDNPGYYSLTTSLQIYEGTCITISANDVILSANSSYYVETIGINESEVGIDNAIKVSAGVTGTILEYIEIINNGTGIYVSGIFNEGTIADMSGSINNAGPGNGIYNNGTITNISGNVLNIGVGNGIYNNGTITDISGNIGNSGDGYCIYNGATITDISGTIQSTGDGSGIINEGIIDDISGSILNEGLGYGISSSGTITINSSPTITNTGGGTSFDNSGEVNGFGTISVGMTLQTGSNLNLSAGLTILGTLTNGDPAGSITPVTSFDCTGISKFLGSINDGNDDYAMCTTVEPPILVSSITVTGAGNVSTVVNGSTLQMSASVLPANATDQTVTWSKTNGTGSATIDASGLLSATGAGTVTVRATANDGSGIYGEKEITITAIVEDTPQSSGGGGGGSSRKKVVPQNQLTPTLNPTAGPTPKPRDIYIGSQGNDVKTLQIILNILGYNISTTGPGSTGNETIYFGEKTRKALIKFQKDNGVTPPNGYFGPKTRDILIIKLIKLLIS